MKNAEELTKEKLERIIEHKKEQIARHKDDGHIFSKMALNDLEWELCAISTLLALKYQEPGGD